jgi:DMSO/TMAO reductase YedYZ molybdopterin-dependent catalytic subunit
MKNLYIILLTFSILLINCRQVRSIEIQDYKGLKLGSVNDFRENSIKGVQKIDINTYTLQIDGLVNKKASYNYSDLQKMNHITKVIVLNCVEGWSVKALWEGIPLADFFKTAEPLKNVNTVIFHASDGYTTSIPYSYIMDKNIMIADKINGMVLPPAQGYPFILAAESKWGYKWCRWITRIELSADANYKGYWEEAGYSQKGDLSGD